MDVSLPSTSGLAASYEAGQAAPVDPMDLTIHETTEKLNGVRQEVADMSSRITYLREIRGRAHALLAQADAAEEEANRLEMEQANLDKEVDRLTAVVFRMEDMRVQTKQLTDQMQLDTALQMRHILENGKSIVPRVPPNTRLKRNLSEERSSVEAGQPVFKMPRRDTNDSLASMATSATPTGGVGITSRPPSVNSPHNPTKTSAPPATAPTINKYSPNRSSLTPGSLASLAALSGAGGVDAPRALSTSHRELAASTSSQRPAVSQRSSPISSNSATFAPTTATNMNSTAGPVSSGGPSGVPPVNVTSTTYFDFSGLSAPGTSESPPIGIPMGMTTASGSMMAPLTTATVVTTTTPTQFTTTSPVTVTMFSHGSGSGGGGGGGSSYFQPPPANLFLSTATSSLAHQSGLDDEMNEEDVKPIIGGRDVLYR